MARVGKPGEIAGGGGGEHLGHGPVIGPGHGRIGVEEVTAYVLPFPGPGPFGPLVILTGVVHHEVHADVHALFMAGIRQRFQILHGA